MMKIRPRFCGGFEDRVEGGGVFGGFFVRIKFAVAVVDGDFVPDADVYGVALCEAGNAVFVEGDVRVGIVHDGDGLFGCVRKAAGGKVVSQAKGVAGFVSG